MAFSNSSGRHHAQDHGIKGRRDLFHSSWGHHDPNSRVVHRHNRKAAYFGSHRPAPKHVHREPLHDENETYSHLKTLGQSKPTMSPWIKNILDLKSNGRKVMVFSDSTVPDVYEKFDYSVLTRVIWPHGKKDYRSFLKFRTFAEKKGARVGRMTKGLGENLGDLDKTMQWAVDAVAYAGALGSDDINVDFEGPIKNGSVEQKNFIQALRFMKKLTNRQITVDVAWSPDCIDGRCYDVKGMEPYVDLFFLMAYDERSQIKQGPCVAGPNSNYQTTIKGIKRYLDLGIPPRKMILGLPWYGRDYPCIHYDDFYDVCKIEEIPFRGVNCSDSPGVERGIGEIMKILNSTRAGVKYDENSGTPYFTYKKSTEGYHQVWFDDLKSLKLKLDLVDTFGLRGAGVWNAVLLDNSDSLEAAELRSHYWGLFHDLNFSVKKTRDQNFSASKFYDPKKF